MRPVFIGGCPRSGTTLLGSKLGANSEATVTPEFFYLELYEKYDWNNINNELIKEAINFLNRKNTFRLWDIRLDSSDFLKNKCISTFWEFIECIIEIFSHKHGIDKYKVWIDHTPVSIKFISTYSRIFPDMKFIHIVRDGRAVAASIMKEPWGPNTIYIAANYWLRMVAFGLAAERAYPHDKFLRIKYEDLILKHEETVKKCYQFIQLPYGQNLIKKNTYDADQFTFSNHHLVSKNPNVSRVGAWKKNLTEKEIRIFEYLTGDMLTMLGYEREMKTSTHVIGYKDACYLKIMDLLLSFLNKFKLRFQIYQVTKKRKK